MSTYPVPNVAIPPTGQEAGLSDRLYVRRLRELIGDIPNPADEQGSGTGTALRFDLSLRPVNDDDYFQVIVDGTPLTVVQDQNASLGAGDVLVNFDTGRLTFGAPPSEGQNNIVVYKNTVKWRDSVMLESLLEGARHLWPKLGRIARDAIDLDIQVLEWDYQLPPVFKNPAVRIIQVGVRSIPEATNQFYPFTGWTQPQPDILRIPPSQRWAPGSSIEVMYEAPYASLSEVEPAAQMLPVWYAGGVLLLFREQKGVLMENSTVSANGNITPPGSRGNAGKLLMQMFYTELDRMARTRTSPRPISTYDRH